VIVMPSCAPDSMKDVRRVTASARWAAVSPAAERLDRRERSTAM
jgi:hypothetical protein